VAAASVEPKVEAKSDSYFDKLLDKTPLRDPFVFDDEITIPCPDADTYIESRQQVSEDAAQRKLFGELYDPLRTKFREAGASYEAWEKFVQDFIQKMFGPPESLGKSKK
jgi:hypothetical protein